MRWKLFQNCLVQSVYVYVGSVICLCIDNGEKKLYLRINIPYCLLFRFQIVPVSLIHSFLYCLSLMFEPVHDACPKQHLSVTNIDDILFQNSRIISYLQFKSDMFLIPSPQKECPVHSFLLHAGFCRELTSG